MHISIRGPTSKFVMMEIIKKNEFLEFTSILSLTRTISTTAISEKDTISFLQNPDYLMKKSNLSPLLAPEQDVCLANFWDKGKQEFHSLL